MVKKVRYITRPIPRAPKRPFPRARPQPVWRAERTHSTWARTPRRAASLWARRSGTMARTPLAAFFNIPILHLLDGIPLHDLSRNRESRCWRRLGLPKKFHL